MSFNPPKRPVRLGLTQSKSGLHFLERPWSSFLQTKCTSFLQLMLMCHYFQMLSELSSHCLPVSASCSGPRLLFLASSPKKAYPILPGSLDSSRFPRHALSFPVSASLLLRLPLPSSSFPVEILLLVQFLSYCSTFFVLLGFTVCFILQSSMYLLSSLFKCSTPWC